MAILMAAQSPRARWALNLKLSRAKPIKCLQKKPQGLLAFKQNTYPVTTLLAKLGGPEVVGRAVQLFYDKVLNDPQLSPFFKGVDIESLSTHQKKFLLMVLDENYCDSQAVQNRLCSAHKNLIEEYGLEPYHFDYVKIHLLSAFQALNTDYSAIEELDSKVEVFRDMIFNSS